MSLLILFPQNAGLFCWTDVSTVTATWTDTNFDMKDKWGDWESLTWGEIESSGITWAAMSGDVFVDTSTTSTTWTETDLPEETCS